MKLQNTKYHLLSFTFYLLPFTFSFAQTTATFNCTGSSQSFTVPPCVTSINVTVEGAQGGGTNGGNGATVTATLSVTPGQVLQVNVGCRGNCPGAGGFGGGGSGPSATSSGCASGAQNAACGGGGASDIRISPNGLGNRLIVAGGGGGMGGGDTDASGGTGGCNSGGTGGSPFGQTGSGGSQSSGGTGGAPWISSGNAGTNGSLGVGGNGGSDPCYNVGPGGGGGGGYYGGGGGGSDCFSGCPLGGGAGSGGSSLTPVGGSCTPNNGSGNGQVTITYTAGSAIPGTATASSNPQCAGQTTTLSLAGSSGTIQWEMSTNGGSTWSNIGGATASTYTTTLTVNTCFRAAVTNCGTTVFSNQVCVTATTNPAPAVTASQTNILCNGNNTGSATVTVTNGGAPLTYNWSPNVSSTSNANNLSAGSYNVTVTNTFGCSTTQSFTITQPAAPLTSTPSQANVSCFNGSNGSAAVIANGGTGAYSYLWNTGSTSASLNNLVAGNFSVTVTDANNCTSTQNYSITEPTAMSLTASQTNVTCNGMNNGSASVSVSGGTTNYSYVWSPNVSSTGTANNLGMGNYTVTITDANGCTLLRAFTISEAQPLVVTQSQTNILCNGASTGSASVSVSGGVTNYSYSWNTGATSASLSNLTAGNYSVTITDGNGCISNQSFNISQPNALSVTPSQTNVLCNGASTGSASVAVSGGTTNYSYLWNTGGTSASLSNLSSGNYSLTVTDANNCTSAQNFTITEPTLLSAAPSQTNILCNGASTGSASVSVSGGVTNYSYSWNTGATTSSISNLPSSNYSVTVTDANNCSLTQNFTLTQPAQLTSVGVKSDVSCFGGTDGGAAVSASGGTTNYSYSWNTGATQQIVANLPAGNYSVTVTDANGCTSTQSFTVTEPTLLSSSTSQTNVSCFGGNDGSATLTTSGGTTNYSYLWSNGVQTQNIASLQAGNYSVTVTDANNCTSTQNITISQPAALSVIPSQTDILCFGNSTGSASVNVSGGVTNYSYLWSNLSGLQNLTGLSAGNYSVTVTDANNCTAAQNFTITEPTQLTSTISQTNVGCSGGNDATATVSASGGTTNYSYLWNTGVQTQNIASLQAGNYSVTVTDANNCTSVQSTTVAQPAPLTTTSSQTEVSCNGGNDGSASASASGGTTNYSYLWSNLSGFQNLTGLSAGNYSVTVTDANGCTSTQSYTITEPTLFSFSTNSTNSNCGQNDGSASLSAGGATSPYSYLWDDGQTSPTANNILGNMNHCITITDANGCDTSVCVFVTDNPAPVANASATAANCKDSCNGIAVVGAFGVNPPFTYLWNNSANTDTATNLCAGNYSVTVTDTKNCSVTANAAVVEPAAVTITVSQGETICVSTSTTVSADAGGGNGSPYTYSWNNDNTITVNTQTVSPTANTCYVVFASDVNGCISPADSQCISLFAPLSVIASNDTIICSGAYLQFIASAAGGNGTHNLSWTDESGSVISNSTIASVNAQGTNPNTVQYFVSLNDNCSPQAKDTVNVSFFINPVANFTADTTSGCEPLTVTFFNQTNPFNNLKTSKWIWGDGTSEINNSFTVTHTYSDTGTFTVELDVISNDGDLCADKYSIIDSIHVNPIPDAGFTASPQPTDVQNMFIDFNDISTGNGNNITKWQWFFYDNDNSALLGTDSVKNPKFNFSSSHNPSDLFTYFLEDSGDYPVTLIIISENGCPDTIDKIIHINGIYYMNIPNAFSPNNDGLNEFFFPSGVGILPEQNFNLFIFDRWGDIIFISTNLNRPWDGKDLRGKPVQEGVYIWMLKFEDVKNEPREFLGRVTLVR